MPQIINTNIASLTAQRNLNSSQNALNTSLQRLSSGLRINSAKDDAAGLAISERFTTQIRGLNQASRNANDAISLSQTAEGALGEVGNNLQRIRELAVQSANATNSASDRAALDLEVQQRLAEVDRIASTTSFNGQKILDGSFGTAAFQVGANVGETISLDLSSSSRTNKIGTAASATTADLSTAFSNTVAGTAVAGVLGTGDLTINGSAVEVNSRDAADQAAAISLVDGVTATGSNSFDAVFTAVLPGTTSGNGGDFTTTITVGSNTAVVITSVVGDGPDTLTAAELLSDINGNATLAAQGLVVTEDTSGVLSFSTTDGSNVTIGQSISTGDAIVLASGTLGSSNGFASADVATHYGTVSITSDTDAAVVIDGDAQITNSGFTAGTYGSVVLAAGDFTVKVGTGDAVAIEGTFETAADLVTHINSNVTGATATFDSVTNKITMNSASDITLGGIEATDDVVAEGTASGLGFTTLANSAAGDLTSVDIKSVAGANDAIFRIDSSLTSISDLRSTFGAIQNRFESTISNLSTAVESLSAARSRIQDADFASETAALTRAQILQQAGVSILSQANSLPQSVLGLLQ